MPKYHEENDLFICQAAKFMYRQLDMDLSKQSELKRTGWGLNWFILSQFPLDVLH